MFGIGPLRNERAGRGLTRSSSCRLSLLARAYDRMCGRGGLVVGRPAFPCGKKGGVGVRPAGRSVPSLLWRGRADRLRRALSLSLPERALGGTSTRFVRQSYKTLVFHGFRGQGSGGREALRADSSGGRLPARAGGLALRRFPSRAPVPAASARGSANPRLRLGEGAEC
jgi:hypothetical protein